MSKLMTLIAGILIVPAILVAQLTEQWVNRYNGPYGTQFNEVGNVVKADAAGNVYVAGYSTTASSGNDFVTIKYNSSGETLWVRTYNGPGNGEDVVQAIAIDADGNVYVTGNSIGSGGVNDYDYATIKYNSSGVQQWVDRYSRGSLGDVPTAIAVDGSGNVYVTGRSPGAGNKTDYATIKYNSSSGGRTWVRTYDGGSDDNPWAIAVDGSGNVYVTGQSWQYGAYFSYDYLTVKYDASGNQLWAMAYDNGGSYEYGATAIAVDASGYVYVTGGSTGSGLDYATVKYNSSGSQQWATRYVTSGYDRANAIALDGSGNVYVTGVSNNDYATVKYNNSNGSQAWAARYNPSGGLDEGRAVALDGSGNVYVTGYSAGPSGNDYATIKYTSGGAQVWLQRYDGAAHGSDQAWTMAVDGSGNVYACGQSIGSPTLNDLTTVKYNSGGTQQWVARYSRNRSDDAGQRIAVDASGNVYATGYVSGASGNHDYVTIKYNSSTGETLWARYYNGPGNGDDRGTAVAVDGSGNVYVTGQSTGSGTGLDYATVKYSSSGVQQWIARYGGSNSDFALSVAVDASGNSYVTGNSFGSGTGPDYATVKYNSSGVEQWVVRYDGNSSEQANKVIVDASGNAYVTGYSYGSGGSSDDYITIKYNSGGVQQWLARYNGGSYDYAQAIALDGQNNVIVAGYSYVSGTYDDYTTVKYGANGNQLWVARYAGTYADFAHAIAVDASGNVYVTGVSYNAGIDNDYVTVKYTSTGTQQWLSRYAGPAGGVDVATGIAVNGAAVYVTGYSTGSGTGEDYATLMYNAGTGNQAACQRYTGPGSSSDRSLSVATGPAGSVCVTGYGTDLIEGSNIVTIKYLGVQAPAAFGLSSPTNGLTGVAIEGDLTWEASTGADHYEVTLGSNVYEVATNSYHYSNLSYLTQYSWNVAAHNDGGATASSNGPFSFWAIIEQPAAFGLESPDDEATKQELSGQLEWAAASRADGYDVYFGTNPASLPLVSDGQEGLTWDYSDLECGTTYYWQVVAVNTAGETESDVWSFTTGTIDVGVTEIIEPSGLIDTLQETPKATVYNYGTLTRSFDVTFEIRDSVTFTLRYKQTVTVTDLAEGESRQVNDPAFPDWDVPNDREGRYYETCYTVLAGDINVHNDTASSQFAVEASPQQEPAWTKWSNVPAGGQSRVVQHGAAAATDPSGLYYYLLKGNNTCEFYRYDPATQTWSALDPIPEYGRDNIPRTVKEGGTLAQVNGKFYATKGGNCLEFWEYDPAAEQGYRWTQRADVPAGAAGVHCGASATGVKIGTTSYVHLLKASATFEFYQYDVAQNVWAACATAPGAADKPWARGSGISYDGVDTIFALKGEFDEFYAYVVSTNTWQSRASLPFGSKNKQAKGGAAVCYHLRKVYCLKGSNSQEFWVFDCNSNTWTQGGDVPLGASKSRVQDGGTLVYCRESRYLFATKGNSLEFWSYGRLTNYGQQSPDVVVALQTPGVNTYGLVTTSALVPGRDRVAFALPTAGNVSLKLYDMTGRVARVLVNSWRRAGRHEVSLGAASVARGAYVLRYAAGDHLVSRKLIIE